MHSVPGCFIDLATHIGLVEGWQHAANYVFGTIRKCPTEREIFPFSVGCKLRVRVCAASLAGSWAPEIVRGAQSEMDELAA
jgi:hypothetical protein